MNPYIVVQQRISLPTPLIHRILICQFFYLTVYFFNPKFVNRKILNDPINREGTVGETPRRARLIRPHHLAGLTHSNRTHTHIATSATVTVWAGDNAVRVCEPNIMAPLVGVYSTCQRI